MTPEDMITEWDEKAEICLEAFYQSQMAPNTVANARRTEVLNGLYTSFKQFSDALHYANSLGAVALASTEEEQE